jgi:hypothetical protein
VILFPHGILIVSINVDDYYFRYLHCFFRGHANVFFQARDFAGLGCVILPKLYELVLADCCGLIRAVKPQYEYVNCSSSSLFVATIIFTHSFIEN